MAKRSPKEGDSKKEKDEPIQMYYWRTRGHEGVCESYFEAVGKAAVWTLRDENGSALRNLNRS